MKHTFPLIAADFANIPVTRVPKVKVGVVGEIYEMCIRDRHHPCQAQLAAHAAVTGTVRCRMIFV